MPLSVNGYPEALYVNPADLTKLSPGRILVLEEQGRARIGAENAAEEAKWEAHMKQKYGENFDCKFEFCPSPTLTPNPLPLPAHPIRSSTPFAAGRIVDSAIVGRKDRSRYDRIVDSAWGKLQETKRSGRQKWSTTDTNRL